MKPERWKQIEQLYYAALKLDADRRQAFLAQAGEGDEELQREVASLLASDHEAGSFLTASALEVAANEIATAGASSPIGRQIGHYQVLSLLGAGGMGEVYLARDTRLGRKIALKLLPAELTTDTDRLRRFEQEARAASALNHPNIITIFDIGQEGSTRYIAAEFIDGNTLRRQMESGRIDLGLALDVAAQVAAALAAAHEAGIVHRDIKPENVMIRRDGYVKVLDFGLAKLTEPSSAPVSVVDTQASTLVKDTNTESGVVMGTPRYMSPEQARGEKVDARADIFSLGVALFEMITGQAPFNGATSNDVIAAILRDDPPQLTDHEPGAPRELEKIVSQALRKDREERYQNAKDLLHDINLLKQDIRLQTADTSNRDVRDNSSNARPKTSPLSIRNRAALVVLLIAVIAALIPSSVRLITERFKRGHSIETPRSLPQNKLFLRLTVDLGSGVALEMAQLPGGEYEMGSNIGEGEDDESPRHKEKVDSFAIGVYEITQAQWKAVMGGHDNPSQYTGNDNLPVDNVSWALAQDFINALKYKTGQEYRLPTEREWEYAARADSTGKWSFADGQGELSDYAWYSRNAAGRTRPVGEKAPNKWGLFDMQGNVMELCQDWYDEDAYKPERRNPPQRKYHVLRGGCIVCDGSGCRMSFRDYDESGPGKHVGFRIAKSVEVSEETKPSIIGEVERER